MQYSKKSFFLLLVVGIAVGYLFLYSRGRETVVVAGKTLTQDIMTRGRVVAAESSNLAFDQEGIIREVNVKGGQTVKFGEVLALLNTSVLEADAKRIEADIALSKMKLSQALSGISKAEVALAKSKAVSAKTAMDNARLTLDGARLKAENDLAQRYALAFEYVNTVLLNADDAMKALSGIYDEKNQFREFFIIQESKKTSDAKWQMIFARTAHESIKTKSANLKSEASHESIDLALSDFKTNLEVIRSLLSTTAEILDGTQVAFGSPDIGSYKTTVAVARSVLNETQGALLDFEQKIASQKIEGAASVTQAHNDVKQSEVSLKALEDELALKELTSQGETLPFLEAEIKERESSLSLMQEKIRGSVLVAPADGVIENVQIGKGGAVKAHAAVATFTPFANFQVEAELDPRSSVPVHAGDEAVIFFGATQLRGNVAGVPGKSAIIYFDDAGGNAALHEEARVRIIATIKRNALMVPYDFISEEKGVKKVSVLERGEEKQRVVLTGIVFGNEVEIIEGVSEGELLVK
ncbi:hypothetical protein A3C91_01225 [Candidatus Azambacteria bacterium RIFCSPHIGHO2_02_FULL_52_12]|uniref:Uncharacterized protein n=1 Tax=Candidatus Azambacteria bacterium RIFCSPLOWO2_01_FULL_46_25 TaxID=1797298 RepID=A0A1F5BV92_9BACT|nr:MAG: hypothetical protein A3C91_01225 [Candidatus Azambacteria bacterium RIFCSPHIGHO2_02_FULL_52_12]OGD34513.1 MAG: hypothetical protein A2988_03285 [Candidatus Azambacteria bacterium RIFCSPLOWO2_01_FULL_46_25]OGD36386.1 MAG: hypothetical protein A2850_01785 [Candidatus Azambacteria bacterium RIFCSPHIGHO2_01_FULL_51_74]